MGMVGIVNVPPLTTGERIRLRREARGMSRAVVAGLVGRSPDWLKKIERGERQLNSIPLLLQLADVLGVSDLSMLTGDAMPVPVAAWDKASHPVVPEIRRAMHEAPYISVRATECPVSAVELQERVRRAWLLWHSSPRQRTDVGVLLPELIRLAHGCVRRCEGRERRRAQAVAGDLYRLVQRLLAHICEPELHALAVERGRAMSEGADTPSSLALAAWSSSVSLCASGHFDDAARLADIGTDLLRPLLAAGSPDVLGTYGALQLEAAAAHGLAGRGGDAFRYLDAAGETARRLPSGYWHPQSAFERTNVDILSVIVDVSLRRVGDAIGIAKRLKTERVPSIVRRSRVLLETAHAYADKREIPTAIHYLDSAASVSVEAVALIPWARTLADDLAGSAPATAKRQANAVASRLRGAVLA